MEIWAFLPYDVLAHIYKCLPRRDRLACSLVCENWKLGLDNVTLWKKFVIYIDRDFLEPSTILLMRNYCKHIKFLEIGWAFPYSYMFSRSERAIKSLVRILLIFHDNHVQLLGLKLFHWLDLPKPNYHLCRFLRTQFFIKKLILKDLNVSSITYSKILSACFGSKENLQDIEIHCSISYQVNNVYFRSCVEQFTFLKMLKINYFAFSFNVIDALSTSRNPNLNLLEVTIYEIGRLNIITEEQWSNLRRLCPNVRVYFLIYNICQFNHLSTLLKESIPLAKISLTFTTGKSNRPIYYNYRSTLKLLITFYQKTLETITLHARNDIEIVDDLLVEVTKKLTVLKSLSFDGVMENPSIINRTTKNVKYCYLIKGEEETYRNMREEEVSSLRSQHVHINMLKKESKFFCSMIFLNQ